MGTIYIPEPQQPTDYDISSYSLYVMKINVNRMEHMIKSGTTVYNILMMSGRSLN